MEYIINNTVIFGSDTKLLYLYATPEIFTELSNPATRLLATLIMSNTQHLSRELLLKKVWEEHGFTSSYSLLSNHISELRKAFTNLGITTDIIVTIPRIGFKVEADIAPWNQDEVLMAEIPTDGIQTSALEYPITNDIEKIDTTSVKPIKWKTLRLRMNMKNALLALSALLATGSFLYNYVLSNNGSTELIDVYNKCHIYQIGDAGNMNFNNIITQISAKKIDCLKDKTDIFYIESQPSSSPLNVKLLSVCIKGSGTGYRSCTNYISTDGG
ncbi:transcriptional regulator [Serratia nematodiphila]